MWDKLYKKFNYPSEKRFYEILRDNNIKATHKEVKEWIKQQNIAQVHKPITNIKAKQRHIIATAPYETYQMDLLDYQKYARNNNGNRYILICVDLFTRKAYAEAIKTKKPTDTKQGLSKILLKETPSVIYSDNGNEWKGDFKKFLNEKNILHFTNEVGDHNTLGIIDRFSRTIKNAIAKYMTANNTTQWVNILEKLIKLYNNTPHTAINDIKPKNADKNPERYEIGAINFEKQKHNAKIDNRPHNLHVGDYVRIQQPKKQFKKGYEITYSKDIYKINKMTAYTATLDDGKNYKINKLLKTYAGGNMGKEQEKENKKAIIKRKLRREGL